MKDLGGGYVEGESEFRDRYGNVPESEEEEDRGDEDEDDW